MLQLVIIVGATQEILSWSYKNLFDMKKIYIILLSVLFPTYLLGQSGTGTSADPYHGTISTSAVWNNLSGENGTVYVGRTVRPTDLNLSIVSGGSLTINSGVTVVFLGTTSTLIITGTGVLTINGTSSANVTLTKAMSQPNWGDVYFNASTGASSINYCNINYGLANNGDLSGGGIYINSSTVTIKNSKISNCSALYGGGIEIAFSSSIIENCVISNNIGSGIDVFGGSPLITNCTIIGNTNSNDSEYGGIQNSGGSPIIQNCILWNNSGPGGMDYTGGGSISYSATKQGVTGTGMITLNSGNTDPTGPNFIDPLTNNYNLTFISPCRDAGISTGAPLTDILGNSRIGLYDIGAYEVQYSNWTGATSTDWATITNWSASAVPTSGTSDVIIPSGLVNYPTGSPSQNFTIGSGKKMILNPGAKATLNALTNNGTLKIESDANNISSLIVGSFSGTDATVELFLTGGEAGSSGSKTYKWHYISTPVSSLPVSTFAPTYTLNVAKFYDDRVSGTLNSGWVAYDGYIYSTGGTDPVRQFSSLLPGIGYDYYDSQDNKYTFSGQLNTSDVTMNLSFAVNDALHGFNLLGNPFPSGLDWTTISSDPTFPLNTSKSVYFTRNNTQCSFIAGVGIPSDVNGIIPPMQGFFVKTYTAGNALKLPASARAQNAIHSRYKGDVIVPLVRLAITENLLTDETVVRFDADAKSGEDLDFDAIKMFISTTSTQIYSSLGGTNYSINGLPFPDPSIEIPIVVNFLTTGNHSINTTQLQGLKDYNVTLTDKITGFVADLKATPVITFSATAGTIADRFVLKIGTITTGTENLLNTNGAFNIYSSFGSVNIQTLADDWDGKSGSVKVQDLTGKIVGTLNNITFSKNSLVIVPADFTKGIYLVELRSGMKRYVGKVVIR